MMGRKGVILMLYVRSTLSSAARSLRSSQGRQSIAASQKTLEGFIKSKTITLKLPVKRTSRHISSQGWHCPSPPPGPISPSPQLMKCAGHRYVKLSFMRNIFSQVGSLGRKSRDA